MEVKKMTQLSMFLALAVILNLLESMIPFFSGVLPGLKLGLANIVFLVVLYRYSWKDAYLLSILRVFLVGLLRTGLFGISFFLSLGGAVLSMGIMIICKKWTKLSMVGVSIAGSFFHSFGQILVAIFLLKQPYLMSLLPWFLLFSIPTGVMVGLLAQKLEQELEERLPKSVNWKEKD